MMLTLALAATLAYVAWFYAVTVRRYPRGPFPWPFIGNLLQLHVTNFPLLLEQVYGLSQAYGTVFTVFVPMPVVVLANFDAIKEALVTKGENLTKPRMMITELFTYVDGGGIMFSNGDNWREQRRFALGALRDLGVGKSVMEERIAKSVADTLAHLDALEDKSNVDLFEPIKVCAGNVINEVLFGTTCSHRDPKQFMAVVANFHDVLTASPLKLLTSYGQLKTKMRKHFDFISEQVQWEEEHYRPKEAPTNFAQAYLQAMSKRDSPFLTRDQLIGVASDFWSAGMDTTSTTLRFAIPSADLDVIYRFRWAILYMLKWPDVQKKAQEEIDAVVGREHLPSMADKLSMPYMMALVQEVQRYASILNIMRTSTADQTIGGKFIPSGSYIAFNFGAVLRHDPIFENPSEFKPERFLCDDGKTIRKDLMERMVQFSVGKRNCAGESLARMELFLILSALLQRYSFVATGAVDLTPRKTAVLEPKDFTCHIVLRR